MLPTTDLGSSFWGMALILASTNLLTARIAAGCLILSLLIVLFIAKNVRILKHSPRDLVSYFVLWCLIYLTNSFSVVQWTLRGLCIGKLKLFIFIFESISNKFNIFIPCFPGFIIFIAVIWILQETTKARILRYIILFIGICLSFHIFLYFSFQLYLICLFMLLIQVSLQMAGVMNSLFSVYGMHSISP